MRKTRALLFRPQMDHGQDLRVQSQLRSFQYVFRLGVNNQRAKMEDFKVYFPEFGAHKTMLLGLDPWPTVCSIRNTL